MASKGVTTSSAASPDRRLARRSTKMRRRLILPANLGMGSRRGSAGDAPNEQLGERVHDDGDEEQRQSDLHQRTEINVFRGFAELIGDDAGHRVSRGEERLRN